MKKILLCFLAALCCLMAAPVYGAGFEVARAASVDAAANRGAALDQDAVNREIYARVAAAVAGKTDLTMSALTVEVALAMLGTPYVGGTLEGDKEELRVFLDKTDCILFVETCVCMALTFKGLSVVQEGAPVAAAAPSYELFCDNVRAMRYRGGIVDGYASRLHYTSEWILQAQHNGVMKEYTEALGIPREQHFSFMTSHADLYPSLKSDPSQAAVVRAAEQRLDAAGPYFYVPQAKLAELDARNSGTATETAGKSDKAFEIDGLASCCKLSAIRSGDIIFIISGAEGLDISHVAIACERDGAMHFIHASSKAGRVIIEPKTLAAYATRGIRLARLLP